MRKISMLCLFLLAMTLHRAAAQSSPGDDKPFIEVTGIAEQLIVPDEIYIRITLREKYEKKEKVGIESQEEQLKAALKEAGINLANMYLSDADAYAGVRIRRKAGEVLLSKSYTLMVSKVPEVAKVFLVLDKLDIPDADIVKIDHSAIENYRREVKIAAMKAARAKADYLLGAIGQKTGKALIVQEQEGFQPATGINIQYKSAYGANTVLDEYTPGKGEELKYDKIKIGAAVYVKFRIE